MKWYALPLPLLFLVSCGSGANVAQVGATKAKAKPRDCAMNVLEKESDLAGRPVERLCVINPAPGDMADVREDLRAAGCKCGADAVVIDQVSAKGRKAVVTAFAVRYLAAPAATPWPK